MWQQTNLSRLDPVEVCMYVQCSTHGTTAYVQYSTVHMELCVQYSTVHMGLHISLAYCFSLHWLLFWSVHKFSHTHSLRFVIALIALHLQPHCSYSINQLTNPFSHCSSSPCHFTCYKCFAGLWSYADLNPSYNSSVDQDGRSIKACFDAAREARFECRINRGPWKSCECVFSHLPVTRMFLKNMFIENLSHVVYCFFFSSCKASCNFLSLLSVCKTQVTCHVLFNYTTSYS